MRSHCSPPARLTIISYLPHSMPTRQVVRTVRPTLNTCSCWLYKTTLYHEIIPTVLIKRKINLTSLLCCTVRTMFRTRHNIPLENNSAAAALIKNQTSGKTNTHFSMKSNCPRKPLILLLQVSTDRDQKHTQRFLGLFSICLICLQRTQQDIPAAQSLIGFCVRQ